MLKLNMYIQHHIEVEYTLCSYYSTYLTASSVHT